MKRGWRWLVAALGALALLLLLAAGLSRLVYGRSIQATVYEAMLRRRYASKRTAAEEVERLEKRRAKPEPEAALPEDLDLRSKVDQADWHGMRVFALNWEGEGPTVIYLHGGAYINSFNAYQWRFMDRLAAEADCRVLAPAYHLAPWADYARAYEDLTRFYLRALEEPPGGRLLLMGDSAGGGLALGLAEQLAKDGEALPEQLILLSPWVDVSMENPDIADYVAVEPILHLELVKVHGRLWAGDAGVRHWQVSPLYGDMTGLPPTTIFCGTRELLYPDILLAAEKLRDAGVETDLRVGRGLNHDYPLMPIPEGRAAVGQILELVRNI